MLIDRYLLAIPANQLVILLDFYNLNPLAPFKWVEYDPQVGSIIDPYLLLNTPSWSMIGDHPIIMCKCPTSEPSGDKKQARGYAFFWSYF